MPICPSCGAINRNGARFCLQCATPLTPPRPTSEDRDWLAATLSIEPASSQVSGGAPSPEVESAARGPGETPLLLPAPAAPPDT
jgi:PPM family protein phosphatase